jgi:hypothetical protein
MLRLLQQLLLLPDFVVMLNLYVLKPPLQISDRSFCIFVSA